MKNSLIEPKILQGTRDFLPKDMAKRDFVMNKIKSVFINFGYDRIQTPSIEYAETILGKYGDEATKLVYRFKDNGDRDIALRYDQTVPFARLVAANYKNLPMPFKRYQIDRVWRADRPAKGRFREFYQCDADIIGTDSLLAEAETVAVVAKVLTNLGFKEYCIKFNSRRLINSILGFLGIAEKDQASVIQKLDKLDKIGRVGVKKELAPLLNDCRCGQATRIDFYFRSTKEKLPQLSSYNIQEIQEFLALAESFGIPEGALIFERSIARGLDYYTGIVYEAFIPGVDIGGVCGGGRYENLCSNFIDQKFSGVGFAFGFDRLVLAMEALGLLKDINLNSQVLVTYFISIRFRFH